MCPLELCMHALSVHAHVRVCVHTHKVYYTFSFPKWLYSSKNNFIFSINISLSQDFVRLDRKSTLSLGVMLSLENWGLSHKGYKMRCLQLPFFLFVSSVNGIKWKREIFFCFDVQLKPNPCTQQTTRIHGARCNSAELNEICMSEVP